MPSAPRFTQKPSIQQTAQGDLLMECMIEADPLPNIRWQHAGSLISESSRVQLRLNKVSGILYKANLSIKEPNANDGGAYKCTASNQLGESNANINLNFAGPTEEKSTGKGPTFQGKPKITPRDGGALILMECKVKSSTRPTAKWSKDGTPLVLGSMFKDVFADLGDGTYLCQLEIRHPTASEAGQYRCNVRNDSGETNANLHLNFQQEEPSSRPETPSKRHKSREGTPSERERRRHKSKSKSREGSPKKSIRSRTATPTQELTVPAPTDTASSTTHKKRKDKEEREKDGLPPPSKRDRSRSKSPRPKKEKTEKDKLSPIVTESSKPQAEKMEVEEANYKRKLSRSTEDQVVPEKQRVSIESPAPPSPRKASARFADEEITEINGVPSSEKRLSTSEQLRKPSVPTLTMPKEADSTQQAESSGRKSLTEQLRKGSIPQKPYVKKREVPAFMQVQLKRVQKDKKDEKADELELPELKKRGSTTPEPQTPRRVSIKYPESTETREEREFERTEIESFQRRASMRRRSSIDMRRESIGELLEKHSTPLQSIGNQGTPAKIVDIPENVTVLENETAILRCMVEGNPVPTYKWTKGGRDVIMAENKIRCITDGDSGQVSLVISKCKPHDEGDYTLVVKNAHGRDQVDVKLLVTTETGLDFRAMLRKREKSDAEKEEAKLRGAKKSKEEERRPSLYPGPGKREERWIEPLAETTRFQQKVDKIATLKCVYSRANAKVRWYKDRKELFSGGLKYKILIEKQTISLVINNPDPEDTGRYTCEANGVPTNTALTILEPPIKYVFLNPLPNSQEIYRTKQGILTCKVNSARAPLVWYCNGNPVDTDDSRYQIEKDAAGRFTITIKLVEQKDQGQWMAKVTDECISKCQVYVEEPRDTFVVPLKSQRATEKEGARLECDVNDPAIEVEWWHDGKKIQIDGKRYIAEKVGRKRRLILPTARIEDQGEYKCTTKDDSTMAQLICDALNRFLVKLEDQEVFEKDDVFLRCETKDNRTPATWFRNGKALSSLPGSKYEAQSRTGVHTMKISKIEMNEADIYEIDQAGLRGSCKVTVLEAERKPVLNWKPQKIECEAGKEKKIKVPFQVKGTRRGDPKAVLMRNGKPVDMEKMRDLVEVIINGDVAEIIFKNPKREDSGKWSLELSNTGGAAVAPFELYVRDRPKMPKGPLEAKDVTAESCKLKWKPAEPDEQAPTHGYIVEMQDGRGGPWKKIGETKGTDFNVNDLKEHGEYKFRIKAVNNIGESDPLVGETILAKNPFTVPGKPRHMNASDISANSLTLEWDPPESDGGSAVESYTVERRDKSDKDWVPIGQVGATGPGKHQIIDGKVVEGKEYYYRVRAVNKAGPGDPCDHGKPFKVQAKPAPPAFTGGGLQDQRLKVGETIKYEVPISGEPIPTVSWLVKGKPLNAGGRVKMNTEKGKTILKIENAVRGDSGKFTIQLKNKSGECESSANVTVVGRPDPPQGPLKVSDINGEGATLSWKPPLDDGGEPLTGYVVEAQDVDGGGKFVPVGEVGPGQTSLAVKGLKNKGNYKFRVKAVNKEGESEPLATDKHYLIKDPFDEPGKPGRPHITDVDSDKVTLEWDPPSKDGGAPIEEYIIEMKDPSQKKEWIPVASSASTSGTVTGLKEGQECQFRVRARNKMGPGAPSEPCDKIVTEPKFVAAWLDNGTLNDLVVKAGQTARWNVRFGGKPPPDVFWFKSDQQLESSSNLQIDTKKNDSTILCIPACVRSDRGKYTLKVKNSLREAAHSADLTVLSPPSKPKGPLEASNVTEEGCELSWKPPEDDGGEPIECYEVEKMDTSTGKWVPCARVNGCNAAIKGLKKGQGYQFRVKAVNKEGQSEPLQTDKEIIAKNPYDKAGKPGTPEIVDWSAKTADLEWDPPKSDGGAPVEEYIVEKKSKHDRKWKECGKSKGAEAKAHVDGLKPGEEYEFRVIAVNKAGPGEPSDPSRMLLTKNRFEAPRIDRNAMQNITVKSGQTVEFKVPVSGEPPPKKVWAFNDKTLEDPLETIKIKNEDYSTHFFLRNATRNHAGKYTLTATNDSGQDSHSVQVNVLSKPSHPEGPLEVSDVCADSMVLSWKPPLDDGGVPVEFYEVEKMDTSTGRWIPCGKADGTQFKAQNLTPGHSYHFRVRAANKEGESDPLQTTDPVLAKNPFDVPEKMEKPELIDWDKDHVDLEWKTPTDGGAPIEEYIIEKRDVDSGKWVEALHVPAGENKATVPGLREGGEYQFRILAKNKAGLSAPSDPTDPIIAKPRRLAPHIHREDLEDRVVKVGQDAKFNVHVDGEPPAKIEWQFNDGSTPENVNIQNQDYLSKFALIKATRNQAGRYTITAKNEHGVDSVTITLAVKGRSSAPKGPLEVSDVFEDRMTLDWKPPEDDGGEPVDHYEIERQDARDGIWVPVGSSSDPHFVADGLTKGQNYKFRVRAVNSEGKSDPLETAAATMAKNPYDRPSKPDPPELVDWDSDHVDLKWQAPNDCGAPIQEYQIEQRSKYGRWEPAIKVGGDTTEATVPGLTKGEEYEFRIIAVNKGGASDPSDPSRSIVAKPRNLPPKIGSVKPLKIRAGQAINFDVPFEGEPEPEIEWRWPNGGEIRNGGRVKLENEDQRSRLHIRAAVRSDAGTYKIQAENANGKDVVDVKVEVVDKPSAPEGPLTATDVHGDHLTLNWKPPTDDGGCQIENYVVEMFDTATGRWVKAGTTKGDETQTVVNGLIPGHEYKFRVSAVNAEGQSEPLETAGKIIAKEPFDTPGKPGKPEVVDWDKNHAELKWTPPTDDGGAPVEGYVVEMKEKFSPNWKEVTNVPANCLEASVPGLIAGEEYEFRIVAKNKAGKGKPSDPSDPIVAKDRKVPPSIDRNAIIEIKVRAGQSFQLDIPISGEPPPEITWDFEGRQLESNDRVKIVNDEKGTKFMVKRALRTDTGTFNITAQNENGVDKAQVKVTVVDRPSEPRGPLNISNVHKTGCSLDWNPPSDDGGAPVTHYVVEKFDFASGRWVPCGQSSSTQFDVTDLTPGHEYKFRVKAANRYGESDPLEGAKSIIAKDPFDTAGRPGTPDIVDWGKDHADLKWAPPEQDGGAPVEKYVIEKRIGPGEWEYAGEVPANKNETTVGGLTEGKPYQFRVKAVNKAGESSPSNPSRTIITKDRRVPPKIDRSMMPEIKVKKGAIIGFDVNVQGEPNPKCEWMINNTPLHTSERTKIDNTSENNTKLKTRDAQRADSGTYKLIATNEHGRDEAEVLVVVLDVPDAPKGPLEARDVTKECATLKWLKPDDDGGSPITHYAVEKLEEGTGRWVPCGETPDTNLRVNRLVEGKEYKFRVKAVNRQGESKPLTMDHSIIAKNPWDVPGKPQDVKIVDWDKDHMDLEWKPPIIDGGAPIDQYIIEKKDKFGDWMPCATVPGDQHHGTAPGLVPGETYQFRVRAVNKAGPGEASDPTEPKVAKSRRLAPKLHLDSLTDIKVKAGQPFKIEAKFDGEPPPKASWTINGNSFEGTSHTSLDNRDNLSTIYVESSLRSDSGPYSITVLNEFGSDSGKCTVVVLDVPTPPVGPLKAKDIHKEGCTLAWSPPEDDGGSEIIGYIVEKMDTSRGTWQEVGQFSSCDAKVKKLITGKRYLFRVKAVNVIGESKPLEGDREIIAKDQFDVPDKPDPPIITDWDETRIDTSWKAPNDGGSPIREYIVERREKGSAAWLDCGRTPTTSFSCTGLCKGHQYEFRVTAVNEVGPSQPSDPSVSQVCQARFLRPQIISQKRSYKVKAGFALTLDVDFVGAPDPAVKWNLKDVGSLPSHLIADSKVGHTSIFFPSTKRSDTGIYHLNLKNEIGEDDGDFELIVQDRPAPPKGPIQVENITKESCSLSWDPPDDDGGSPITNYVIERRELPTSVWTPVSNFIAGTSATVTKLVEGKEYEFRIMAENAIGRSDPLVTDSAIKAKDPFGTPGKPGRPTITDFDKDHIDLEWTPPTNNGGNPITHYDVQRKDQKTGRWMKINTQPVYGTSYSDTRVQPGHGYEYRVVAVNKAGPGQPSDPSDITFAKPQFEAPRFELDIDGKEVRVRAGNPLDIEIPYVGSPQPDIHWTKDGREISDVTTTPNTTRLYIPVSKRSDSGQCRISAENTVGRVEARVLISVIDKPGAPEGPITYPATTRHSITFAWKPPKDDGGAELNGYKVEWKEIGARDWERAPETVTLLSYIVKGLEKDHQYQFRVFAENMAGLSEPLNGEPITAKDPFDPPGAPGMPEVTAYDSNMVSLRWNPPRDNGGSPITGYIVERFEKRGGGDWAPVTSLGIVPINQATVNGLAEGETYQFRVRAVNAAGEGPPSQSCEPVTCKPFVQPPGRPDRPRIGKVTKNSVGLNWMRPLMDGGAPIEGYIVEFKKPDQADWNRANNGKLVKDVRYTVDGLPEKEQFEFRIIAVNKAGESEPSKPSDIVFTEDEPGRPILDLSGLKDITVRAGETITFSLPYSSGGIKPTVDVFNKGQTIYEDERTTVDVDNEKIVFTTKDSKRSDAGPYKVIVQNRFGKDFAKLNVNVLDVPGKPTGPILFSEISGEAITLHWSPPKDDGGAPVQNYVVEKLNPSTGTWDKVGQPAGTSFRVRGLEKGQRYDFRVSAENQYGVGLPLDADQSIVAKNPFDVPGPPGPPEPLHTAEDSITLQWLLHDGGAPILGYVLEKREAGTSTWEKAAFGHIPETRYKVNNLKPHHTYEFRVAAINAAGQGDWSESSVPIVAAARPSRPIITLGMLARDLVARVGDPVNLLVPYAASPRPEILWKKNGIPVNEQDPRLRIESNDYLTQLNYPSCQRDDTGTYSIRIENDLGSDSADLRLKVVDRPSPPEGPLNVDEICPESCRLSWNPPKDDGGSPITNYVIEKCHIGSGSENWERLSSFVRKTNCLVTGLQENERYRFRVSAENQYGVSDPLELSEPIVAKYQFQVPAQPDPPIVRDFDRTWAEVEWEPPSDGGSRILGYNIQYRDEHSHKWVTANKFLIEGKTNFRVQNLRDQGEYEFRVLAKNAAGWSKASLPSDKVQLRQRIGPPGPPLQVHAQSIGPNWCTLTWTPPVENGGSRITGYAVEKREIGTAGWLQTNDSEVPLTEFTVPNLREFHDYEFRVIAINAHGRGPPSLPTSPIKIQELAGGKPYIVVRPDDVQCPYNKRAIFTCQALGRPTPTVRWLRNGREVPDGARYRVEAEDGIYRLIIKEVWDIDGGDYTIEVSNSFGAETATATLHVQAPPVIEKQVPSNVHPEGDMVRLKIYFSGSPPFNHRLTLNGVQVSPDSQNIRYVDFDNHLLLTIPELHSSEAGRYEYTVSNESGESTTGFWINVSNLPGVPEGPLHIYDVNEHQASVSWRPPIHDGGSRITNYILEKCDSNRPDDWVTVASAVRELGFTVAGLFPNHEYEFRVSACNANGQGPALQSDQPVIARLPFDKPGIPVNLEIVDSGDDFVVLSWHRPEKDGGGRLRGYIVEKREDGTDYWQKCTQTPSPSSSLNITNLIDGRKYSFRVIAVNDAGESQPALVEDYVFKIGVKGRIPEITSSLQNQFGNIKDLVTFECEVGADPRPEIQWFRGTKELVGTSKWTLINKGQKQVLIISNLHNDDEDEYSCRATNEYGSRTTRAHLKIGSKPHVFIPPKYQLGVEVEKGNSVELRIPYKAFPEGTATWSKDGVEIANGGKWAITTEDKVATLRISDTIREDAGEYRILVHNPAGSDSGIVRLIIADCPEPPRFPRIENVLDQAVVLSWKPPELEGGALITGYIVEKREGGGQWEKCARSRFCCMTIEGLHPKESYEFRISAENKYGLSQPCEPCGPVQIPESRKRPPNYDGTVTDRNHMTIGGSTISHSRSSTFLNVDRRMYSLSTSTSSSTLSRHRLAASSSRLFAR